LVDRLVFGKVFKVDAMSQFRVVDRFGKQIESSKRVQGDAMSQFRVVDRFGRQIEF
jgi:hypothetical protein